MEEVLGHVTAVTKGFKVSAGITTMATGRAASFPLEGKMKLAGTFSSL